MEVFVLSTLVSVHNFCRSNETRQLVQKWIDENPEHSTDLVKIRLSRTFAISQIVSGPVKVVGLREDVSPEATLCWATVTPTIAGEFVLLKFWDRPRAVTEEILVSL